MVRYRAATFAFASIVMMTLTTGCGIPRKPVEPNAYVPGISLQESDVRVAVLAKSMTHGPHNQIFRPVDLSKSFELTDEVIFFVVVEWPDLQKKYKFFPRFDWYANGKLLEKGEPFLVSNDSPCYFWGTYLAILIGPGQHRVEAWVGSEKVAEQEFTVGTPTPTAEAPSPQI